MKIIDTEAALVGDLHRAAFQLKEENRMLREILHRCIGEVSSPVLKETITELLGELHEVST